MAGNAWRPGGLALTEAALDWCEAAALLQPGPESLVVDCGAGAGASLRLLAARGYRALGLDRQAGEDEWPELPAAAALIRADCCSMPLASNCARLALFECVLSLVARPEIALQEARRILRAGALLVASDVTWRAGALAGPDADAGSSCLAGARSVAAWQALFTGAGFRILRYENHDRALVELAAQMIWHGVGGLCACGAMQRRHGYGLWIVQKER